MQNDDSSLDLWLNAPAPRYTSYPPAPFFSDSVGADRYEVSLRKIPKDEAISLYVHIPFCPSLCLYCGCNTIITKRADRIGSYLQSLKREIILITRLIGKRKIASLHFGGGTPNSLSEKAMRDLFATLRGKFDMDHVREISMEIDPRIASASQAQVIADCGVTRVSLGVQDFDTKVQDNINRRQSFEMVAEVCGWLRTAGIKKINFDLIYGLPGQSPQTMVSTILKVCRLAPTRIALFSYAHVPQMKRHQMALERLGVPNPHEKLALERIARLVLCRNGYEGVGIDHFVHPDDNLAEAACEGRLHRDFQGYTDDEVPILIGLGASSIGRTRDGYFQNERDECAYKAALARGRLPTTRGFLLSDADRLRGAIIEKLMCDLSCDLDEICRDFGVSPSAFEKELARLEPYIDRGLVARHRDCVILTSPYRMAVRAIAAVFDDYAHRSNVMSSRVA